MAGLLRRTFGSWWFLPRICPLSLTCSMYSIDDWLIYFHRYTFPWLCVWEGCIVILLAHDKDLASLLAHPHTGLPLHGKTQNVRELSDIRLPIWAVLGRVVWTDSGSCRCYHSDGFLSSWIFSSDSAQSMICAIGRIPDGRVLLYACHSFSSSASCRCAWLRHQMETFSAFLALCAGNSPVTGEFPSQRPVTRSFDVFLWSATE